jgi:hypothetical protein
MSFLLRYPATSFEVPCEVAGTQLVADVRAPTVELPDQGDDRAWSAMTPKVRGPIRRW